MLVGFGILLRLLHRHRGVVLVGTALAVIASLAVGVLLPRLTTPVSHAASLPLRTPDTVGVVVPSAGTNLFELRYSNTAGPADKSVVFGAPGMIPIAGEWDGHGISTIGVYDQSLGEFWLSDLNENGGPITYGFPFGSPGDLPLVGNIINDVYNQRDYDSVGAYDPTTSTFSWACIQSSQAACSSPIPSVQFGSPGDMPLVGDWTGIGVDSIGVYRPSTGMFYLDTTPHGGAPDYAIRYGPIGATPIVGDWTRSGHSGIGVVANGIFYLKNDPLTSGIADDVFAYGPPGATPIVGHFVSPRTLLRVTWFGDIPEILPPAIGIGGNHVTLGPDGNIWSTARECFPPPDPHAPPVCWGIIVRLAPVPGTPVYDPVNVTGFPESPGGLLDTTRITTGPDGNLWFGDNGSGFIGKITTSGSFTLYTPPSGKDFEGVAAGSDGALWYTVTDANEILRVTTSGGFTQYPIPTPNSRPTVITAGPDGALWFTESGVNKIGRISTSGTITEHAASATPFTSAVNNIITGPDGNLWYSLTKTNSARPGHLVKMSPAGAILAEYAVSPNPIVDLTSGPDGNLWFQEFQPNVVRVIPVVPPSEDLGKVTTSGGVTLYSETAPINVGSDFPSFGITSGPNGNIWGDTTEYDLH